MTEIFSSRLITARKMAGFSMQELAGISQISKQSISQYEKGEMMPSSENLISLSNALNVKMDFFFRKPTGAEIMLAGNIHYREKEQIEDNELEIVKLQTIEFLEKYFELERIADNRDEFKNPVKDLNISTRKDAEKAAKVVRKKWKLGNVPLRNILSILESKSIKIFEVEASSRFNGFAAWAGKIPIIVINLGFDEITRVRFTTLHEVAHLVLDINDGIDEKEIERICDAFASELLLPVDVLVVEVGNHRTKISMEELRVIKEKYGISIMAVMVKLAIKGVISWDLFNLWKVHYNELFTNEQDVFGEYTGTESSNRFNQLLSKCLMENKISLNKAASLSNKSISQLKKESKLDSTLYMN